MVTRGVTVIEIDCYGSPI